MVLQRENPMELEEYSKLNIDIQATRERAMDSEACVIDDKDKLSVTTKSSNKHKEHFMVPVEDSNYVHATLASDIIDHCKAKNLIMVEDTNEELIEEDCLPIPSCLKNIGENPGNLLNENTLIPNFHINKDCAKNIETLSIIQHGKETIGLEVTLGEIKYVKSELKPSLEIHKNHDVIGEKGINEPMSIEVIEETTSTTISKNELLHSKLTSYTKNESKGSDVLDTLTKLETNHNFTSEAKNMCERGEEESPSIKNNDNDMVRLDKDLGTCSDIDIDVIVDTIMNDIVSIEADLEVEDKEVDFEVETIEDYRRISSCEKPIEFHYKTTCQDQIQVDGAHS